MLERTSSRKFSRCPVVRAWFSKHRRQIESTEYRGINGNVQWKDRVYHRRRVRFWAGVRTSWRTTWYDLQAVTSASRDASSLSHVPRRRSSEMYSRRTAITPSSAARACSTSQSCRRRSSVISVLLTDERILFRTLSRDSGGPWLSLPVPKAADNPVSPFKPTFLR